MTLTEFRATGRAVDLATIPHCVAQEVTGMGRVYVEGLYIDGVAGSYSLTLSNSSEAGKLEDLERSLYDFGITEGYIEPPTERDELLDALQQLSNYVGGHDSAYGHPCKVASDLLARISDE